MFPVKIFVFIFIFSGCKIKTNSEKDILNNNTIDLSPPPGTYSYMPWVMLTPSEDGLGTGVLNVKSSSDTGSSFSSASNCFDSPYDSKPSRSLFSRCYEIIKTTDLTYFLSNLEASGDPKTVHYEVQLTQNDLNGTGYTSANSTGSALLFKKELSSCKYGSKDILSIMIKLNSPVLGNSGVYFGASLVSPSKGKTITIDEKNIRSTAGISIVQQSDPAPGIYSFPNAYSTSGANTYFPSSGSSGSSSSCVFTISEYNPGGVIQGTLKCTNLLSLGVGTWVDKLGTSLDISGKWQCDKYMRGYN